MMKTLQQYQRAQRRHQAQTLAATNSPRCLVDGNFSDVRQFHPSEIYRTSAKRKTFAFAHDAIFKTEKSRRLFPMLAGSVFAAVAFVVVNTASGRSVGGALASASGVVAALITIVFPWPQLLRSIRLRTAAGVSGASWLMMFFAISGWALYGIEHNDRYQQISSALTLPAVCGVLCIIHRSQGLSSKHAGYTMTATGLGVLAVAFGGGVGSAVVVLGASLLIGCTALASVLSSRVPIGFSAASLNISSLAQVAWLTHAILSNKWVIATNAVLVVVLNTSIVFCAKSRMRTRNVAHLSQPYAHRASRLSFEGSDQPMPFAVVAKTLNTPPHRHRRFCFLRQDHWAR